MHRIVRKDDVSIRGAFDDSRLEQCLYIAVNGFHIAFELTRNLADGHITLAGHDLQQLPTFDR